MTNIICRWCEGKFFSQYGAVYCSSQCRYAYKNERISRRALSKGLTIRELHNTEKLEKLFSLYSK